MTVKNKIIIFSRDALRGTLLKKILASAGFNVFVEKEFSRYQQTDESSPPGVIILDCISMRGDPLVTIERLQNKYERACLVGLSEGMIKYAYFADVEKRVDRLLVNPLNPDEFLNAVKELMEKNGNGSSTAWKSLPGESDKPWDKRPEQSQILKPSGARVVAISGGKGGVGKSVVAANLAAAMALSGKSVVVVDLDLGGPNLHTLFGIKRLRNGILDYLLRDRIPVDQLLNPTNINGLGIIGNTEDYPGGSGGIPARKKMELIANLRKLNVDVIILDLGAGTGLNVIDFILFAGESIAVTSPEITSVLNTYGFMKGLFFRKLEHSFILRKKNTLARIVQQEAQVRDELNVKPLSALENELVAEDMDAQEIIATLKKQFRPALLLNMLQKPEDKKIGLTVRAIARKHLGLDIRYLGHIDRDDAVEKSIVRMSPFFINNPSTPASVSLKTILANFNQEKCRWS